MPIGMTSSDLVSLVYWLEGPISMLYRIADKCHPTSRNTPENADRTTSFIAMLAECRGRFAKIDARRGFSHDRNTPRQSQNRRT